MANFNEPAVPEATLLLVGPLFMGCLVSWMLFGFSVVQLYIWYSSFPNERTLLKCLVYWVFLLDIFLTVVAASMGWHVLCAGWGRETNLTTPGWTFSAIGAGDGIIATTVQIFYAWRIYVLKQWRIVPGVICAIALAQLIATLMIAAGLANITDISQVLPFFPKTIVWLGGGSLADVIIACSMVYLLTSAKRNSHALKSSETAINRLIRLSVETGCITAASAIIELSFFLAPATDTTNLHLFFALILGKMYSNTMMTSLNSRIGSQAASTSRPATDVTSLSITGTHNFVRTGTSTVRTHGGPAPPVVHIASHTEVFADDHYSTDGKNGLGDDMEMIDRKPRMNDQYHSFSPV